MPTPLRILYTHTASLIGGGNKVLLSLFQKLDRSRYYPISVVPERGPLEAELERLSVPHFILDLRPRSGGRLNTARRTAALMTKMIQHEVALVHANDPITYRIASIAAWATRTPRLCHLHHPVESSSSIAWAFARRPRFVLTPTRYVREQVCEWLGRPDASFVRVVGNPIDTEWFSPAADVESIRGKLGMEKDGPHVAILGALAPHKGHECFLRAAALVLRSHPRARFHIVGSSKSGDRAWAERLRNVASELEIANSVHFWGFASDAVARDILRASDLFILPTTLEGFGLVIAEALACAVPVLASAIRPLDEVVTDGESGFLIPPNDHQQFARRAVELLDSPGMRLRFAEYGRAAVREAYGIDAVVGRIVAHYEEIRLQRSDDVLLAQ